MFLVSLLVAMVPKVMTALRLTKALVLVMSRHRGSKTPRSTRDTLFSSPKDRCKRVRWSIHHDTSRTQCGTHRSNALVDLCFIYYERKKPAVHFSANARIPSQALTKMISSEELSSSTAVAGLLHSMSRGENCASEEKTANVNIN